MTPEDIHETVAAFGEAARRAKEAGADGVHIAASGASLFDWFLFAIFNKISEPMSGVGLTRINTASWVIQSGHAEKR